jgi:putative transposase
VERNFHAAAPNRLWVADLTYIKTLQGILYLAVVLDVVSRKVVGWQMADTMATDLVLTAFEMGLWRRDIVWDRLIHHSDKGAQYTSLRFTQRLADAGVAPSTGSVGDSYDNAMAESFFGSLKTADLPTHLDQPARRRTGDLRLDRRLVQPRADHRRIRHAQPRRIRSSVLR